nr:hypothetical protein [Metabacillus crassostreae]
MYPQESIESVEFSNDHARFPGQGDYNPGFGQGPGQGGFNPGFGQGPGLGGFNPGFGYGPGLGGFNPGFGYGPGQGGFNPGFGQGPGQGGFNPGFGQGPGQGDFDPGFGQGPPQGPPPSDIPPAQQNQFEAFAVDPGGIRGCLYRFTYIRLNNGRGFWFYPTFVGRNSVAGYRWRRRQYRWDYFGIDLDRIRSFSCR